MSKSKCDKSKPLLVILGAAILTLAFFAGNQMGENQFKIEFSRNLQTSSFAPFDDVSLDHQYAKTIEFMKDTGVVEGYGDGTFRPEDSLTRAEFLKITLWANGIEVSEAVEAPFDDVPIGEWYTDLVAYSSDSGYIDGYPDGTFKPNQEINKVESLKILGEVVEWDLGSVDVEEVENPYEDVNLEEWYGGYLAYAIDKNILDDEGAYLGSAEDMTRGQMTEYVYRDFAVRDLGIDSYDPSYDSQIIDVPYTPPVSDPVGSDCTDKDAAFNEVMVQIVEVSPYKDDMIVYMKPDELEPGDELVYVTESEFEEEEVEETSSSWCEGYTGFEGECQSTYDTEEDNYIYVEELLEEEEEEVEEMSWFFWLDLNPWARFQHDTKIVLVNSESCEITQYDSLMWPYVDGEELWSTDMERDKTEDARYFGDDAPSQGRLDGFSASDPNPEGTPCSADESSDKRAIVVHIEKHDGSDMDIGILLDAVRMKTFLCENGYYTTTLTNTDPDDLLRDIQSEFEEISEASNEMEGGLEVFAFYTISHGASGSGRLIFKRTSDGVPTLSPAAIANKFRYYLWGDADVDYVTIIQDSCHSGYAVKWYYNMYKEYYNAKRYKDWYTKGWIATSADNSEKGYASEDDTSIFMEAMRVCLPALTGYDGDWRACLTEKTHAYFEEGEKIKQTPQYKRMPLELKNDTIGEVPFLP